MRSVGGKRRFLPWTNLWPRGFSISSFKTHKLRRLHKESLADWILDTQPRTAPLDATALLQYLGAHQPELLNRLKINVRLKEDLARVLESIERN